MIISEKYITATEEYTFSDVVNRACEGLADQQIKYSIRRIRELGVLLNAMDKELSEFLELRDEQLINEF